MAKIRKGFVSNSSSSSFVVSLSCLTEQQHDDLQTLCTRPVGPFEDDWNIYVDSYTVSGYTDMNNNMDDPGGLKDWMELNDFPMGKVKWTYY